MRRFIGVVQTFPAIASRELGNQRDVLVYTPASYAVGEQRYPVIYMQDGQNLFDPRTSFAGDWGLGGALGWAARRGVEVIVVGIPNSGTARNNEYSPFVEAGGGGGDQYLEFVTRTVKPLIDERLRTLPDRAHTGIAGSSMGGLISLYAFFRRPDVFGFTGALSPSLWFANEAIFAVVRGSPAVDGRIYLDVGVHEGERHVLLARRMRDLLVEQGYVLRRNLRWVEDPEGIHHESAWGRRFRKALPFLLRSVG